VRIPYGKKDCPAENSRVLIDDFPGFFKSGIVEVPNNRHGDVSAVGQS